MASSDSQPTKFTAPLKVVPPQRQAPAPTTPAPAAPPPQDTPKGPMPSTLDPKTEDPFGWVKQSLKIGAVCVVLGAIGLIPVPNNVNVGGSLEPEDNKREPVYMRNVSGTITKFLVEAGETIEPNQSIANVDTTELDQEILAKEQHLEEQKRQYTQARQELPILESRFRETELATETAQTQTNILAQRATGQPAEISRLETEKMMIHEGIEGSRRELLRLKEQHNLVVESLVAFEKANRDGGGENSIVGGELIRNKKQQEIDFQKLIDAKNNEIIEFQHQINVQNAEIAALRNGWSEEAMVNQGRTQQNKAGEFTIQREYDAVERGLAHLQKLVLDSEAELAELRKKQDESRVLTSEQGGVVLGDKLMEMQGRKMEQNELILYVADINTMDVVIQVPQFDAQVVHEGAIIKIRFHERGHGIITARIDKTEPDYQPDETGQKRLLQARATIDNPNQIFRPNQEVSVEIIGEKIPLYRKVGLEIRKHINWGKYGIGA